VKAYTVLALVLTYEPELEQPTLNAYAMMTMLRPVLSAMIV
jgi:hypothetical protein